MTKFRRLRITHALLAAATIASCALPVFVNGWFMPLVCILAVCGMRTEALLVAEKRRLETNRVRSRVGPERE